MRQTIWLALALLLSAACGNRQTPEELLAEQRSDIEAYAAREDLDGQFTEEGLYYVLLDDNDTSSVQPTLSDSVTVAYVGTFLNGEAFAEVPEDEPLTLALSQALEGWRIGLPLLDVGRSAIFLVPSELAYRDTGLGVIPPNTILRYDLRLLAVR